MEVQRHRLFSELFHSENLTPDFEEIDPAMDEALVCNSFHRFILTQSMADILSFAITCQQYVLAVEVFQTFGAAKPQKVFQGVLDPSIMAYPGVQNMRFAVQLDYLGKLKPKKIMSTFNLKSMERAKTLPTFAIIKLCLLAPIGEIYKELKVFRESFIRQNRLLFCDRPYSSINAMSLAEIQMECYARFDKFIRDCISFIIDKKVMKLEDKKQHFCCAVQNLTNILMKVVGSVYNTRTPTNTSVDFANLCAFAYNELEPRVHTVVEQIENEGFDSYTISKQIQNERIIDYLNTIKLLLMVNDENHAHLLMEKAITEYPSNERFWFYMVIAYMERGELEKAKVYFKKNHLADTHDYFAGWIKLYINYVDTRNNPETAPDCTECLLRSITNYAERYPRQQDAWILLYCYYKRFNYEPGCAFALWRFGDQHGHCRLSSSSNAPHSLWGLYVNLNIIIPTSRGTMFLEVFRTFARLGLYEFAQVVIAAVLPLASDADRYMLQTQLDMMLNQLDENFVPQSFEFEEGEEGDYSAAMNAQINGNVEFQRGNLEEAALYYESALTLPPPEVNERDFFEVSRLRLGYISYELGNYNKCIEALSFPFAGQLLSIVANYMIGKSYYKLDLLDLALESFANATHMDTHVPNVWGFLALINLRLGENYKAIECWKYAKIEPNYPIDDMMIYEELDAIDYDSVDLYIDAPNQMVDDIFRDSQSDS
uniref:AT19020p n=1 Tax=Drosophila melanogaster TaxID=7227 RepID=Q8T8X6_DROME|nr:AT19020p [Drosophila melanogaster]